MFIKTSFVIAIISDLLTLMMIQIRTFECKLWEPLLYMILKGDWLSLSVCQDNVNALLPVFEEFLKSAPQDASYDSVRQSVVILMGSLAKHLDKSDPKVKPIVAKLITALSTPSQQVCICFCLSSD